MRGPGTTDSELDLRLQERAVQAAEILAGAFRWPDEILCAEDLGDPHLERRRKICETKLMPLYEAQRRRGAT